MINNKAFQVISKEINTAEFKELFSYERHKPIKKAFHTSHQCLWNINIYSLIQLDCLLHRNLKMFPVWATTLVM